MEVLGMARERPVVTAHHPLWSTGHTSLHVIRGHSRITTGLALHRVRLCHPRVALCILEMQDSFTHDPRNISLPMRDLT